MKKLFTTIAFAGCGLLVNAQDYHYSMFTMAPLTLNPALTGNFTGDLRIVNNYRMQWTTVSKPFTTYSFGADMPLARRDKKKSSPDFFAIGLNVNVDKAGSSALKSNSGYGMFSYNKSLDGTGGTYFSIGASLGMCQRSISLADASWGMQWNGLNYDGTLSNGESSTYQDSYTYFDFGIGTAMTMTGNERFKMNLGIAASHLNRPRIDFLGEEDKLYMKVTMHWKAEIALGQNSNGWLVPQAQYLQHGPARLINLGLGAKYRLTERSHYTGYQNEKSLTVGGMYRLGDAFSGYLRIDIAAIGIAFNYDLNVSKLTAATNGMGAMEFMLIYTGMYSNVNTRSSDRRFF